MYKTVIVALLVGSLIGGGTYWYVHNKSEQDKAGLQAKVDTLTNQVSELESAKSTANVSATASTAVPATTAPSSDTRKTYANTTYGVTFKYPKDWIISEHLDPESGIYGIGITDKIVPNSDYPGMASISIYPSLKILDTTTTHTGKTTLQEYLDASTKGDAYYLNVATATVAGKDGFVTNSLGLAAGIEYFVQLDNGKIVGISISTDNTDTKDLLASLTLTK